MRSNRKAGLEKIASDFDKSTTKFVSTDFNRLMIVEDEDVMGQVTKFDQEMKRMLNWDASNCVSKLVDTLRSKRAEDGVWEGAFVAGSVGVIVGLAAFLKDIFERDSRVEGKGARFCEAGKVCAGVDEFVRWVVQV
jgi:uncharacterized protein YjgD (DUF1641 family)